ncbi:hypothetical protein MMC07_004296 [Pseudocyphellaria aurata]|nr:hypothetical protein [Pseudocyphellaria aurata]
MLLKKGADVNAQGGELGNALQAASYGGHDKVVQILLDKGADASRKDMQGRTPLHLACAGGRFEILERLLSFTLELAVFDKQGRNCLHHAASGGSSNIVTWLLENGFDPNLPDRDGWTALHWAAKSRCASTVQVLKDAGGTSTFEAIISWTPHSVAIFHHSESLPILDASVPNEATDSELAPNEDIHPGAAAFGSIVEKQRINPGMKQEGVFCDGCLLDIYGARYHCSDCPDFDYCFKCKVSSDETHEGHRFVKLEEE